MTYMTLLLLSIFLFFITSTNFNKTLTLTNSGKMNTAILTSLIILLILNLLALLPYGITVNQLPYITLMLASLVSLLSLSKAVAYFTTVMSSKSLSNNLPLGNPSWLWPFTTMIELISTQLRPLILTGRIMANLTAGHLLLFLVSALPWALSQSVYSLLMPFELMVAIVQAMIFILLSTIYIQD